jgi:FkbM family methyltransferase
MNNAISSAGRHVREWGRALRRVVSSYQDVPVTYDGQRIVLRGFRDDFITRRWHTGSFYEADLLDHLFRRYGTGGAYADLGAYVGNHTTFFARVCKADRVVAVEPNPDSYRLLLHNIRALGLSAVEAHNVAVGDTDGRCRLQPPPATNRGMATIVRDDAPAGAGPGTGVRPAGGANISDRVRAAAGGGGPDMAVVRADRLIGSAPSPKLKLIKIDTEGWALPVLRGCEQTLRAAHPVVVVETHPDPVDQVKAYLAEFGYDLRGQFNDTPTFIFE